MIWTGFTQIPMLQRLGLVLSWYAGDLQLWHTTSSTTSLPSISKQTSQGNGKFFVEFSPDELPVAITEESTSTVTILDVETTNH